LAGRVAETDTRRSSEDTETHMDNASNEPKRPTRNITWQTRPAPAPCEHEYEVIAHELRGGLRRCAKCGGMEAE
jgi:hypothetical protein